MIRYIIYLTFIPWILYYSSLIKKATKELYNHKLTKKWLKKNFNNIFRFDNLFLIAIFVYFAYSYPDANQIWLVEILLFSVINLYLYFNQFHDHNSKSKKSSELEIKLIILLIIISLIPIIYYISSKNYLITYYIMFSFSFFNYVIAYICKFINDKLLSLFIKTK